MTPTQRSCKLLREQGYTADIAEHYNAFAHVRHDLFGFIDIVAVHPSKPGILGVQTTTGSNLAARISKAQAMPSFFLWLRGGGTLEFHGWRKLKGRWEPDVRKFTLLDCIVDPPPIEDIFK